MKQTESKRLKVNIYVLTLVILLFGLGNSQKTGAWFVDGGTWVDADYGIGVIDYIIYIDEQDIEKMKGGQELYLAVPLIGAVKINEDFSVGQSTTSEGEIIGPHDEFDEGVTLVRTKIINKGGLPIGIQAKVTGADLNEQGMLHMLLPFGTVVDERNYTVKTLDAAAPVNYKRFIKTQLGKTDSDNWATYDALAGDLNNYHNTAKEDGTKADTVVYSGKLESVDPASVTFGAIGFEIDTLCWAEYDQMPYAQNDDARNNADTYSVVQKNGKLIYNIVCTL